MAPAAGAPTGPSSDGDMNESERNPFKLIERGNAMESSGNLWSAADAFGRASTVLRDEAHELAGIIEAEEAKYSASAVNPSMRGRSVTERASARSKKVGEKRKIAKLYLEQSREYLQKGRGCLLKALNFETAEDRRRAAQAEAMRGPLGKKLRVMIEQAEPLVGMISEDERRRRRRIFGRLYAGGAEETKEKEKDLEAEEKGGMEEKKEDRDVADGNETARSKGPAEGVKQPLPPPAPGSAKEDDLIPPPAPGTGATAEEDDLLLPPPAPGTSLSAAKAPGAGKSADDLIPPAAPLTFSQSRPAVGGSGGGSGVASDKPEGNVPPPLGDADTETEGDGRDKGGVDSGNDGGADDGAAGTDNKERSLEERLAQFESSLPPSIKSEKERMDDIKKGLGRLGLNMPDHNASIAKVFQNHMTEEEQINQIMEMAADEARLEGHIVDSGALTGVGGSSGGEGDDLQINDEDDLKDILVKAGMSGEDISGEMQLKEVLGEDGMQLLEDLKANKKGGRSVKNRAAALRLVAAAQELLFEASAHLEDDEDDDDGDEEIIDNEEDSHEESESPIEGNKKGLKTSQSLQKGRASLEGAQKCLEQALRSLPM